MLENDFLSMAEEIAETQNVRPPNSGSTIIEPSSDNSIIVSEESVSGETSSNTWWPTIYINPDILSGQSAEKSTMVSEELFRGVQKATNRKFGVIRPGDGLIIIKPGILSLNVGQGFKIDEATKKIVFDSTIFFTAGNNISIQEEVGGSTRISVVGDTTFDKSSSSVATSKATDGYINTKIGGQENIDPGIISSIQDRNVVGAINKLYKNRTYIHNQISPESEWVIEHELNKRPSVTITTEDNEMVLGEVLYPSAHRVVVRFSTEFSGTAYLN